MCVVVVVEFFFLFFFDDADAAPALKGISFVQSSSAKYFAFARFKFCFCALETKNSIPFFACRAREKRKNARERKRERKDWIAARKKENPGQTSHRRRSEDLLLLLLS